MKCLTCNCFQTVNAPLAHRRVIAQLYHYEGDKVYSVEEGELLGAILDLKLVESVRRGI